MDGGGIERWKDRNYRSVYRRILEGNPDEYDPFEADHRAAANMNELGSDQVCTFFRMFQGWLATSASGERRYRSWRCSQSGIFTPSFQVLVRARFGFSPSSKTPPPT